MGLPSQPVTLSAEELALLYRKFSSMRHEINNNLSLIMAAGELIRNKPHMAERMLATVVEQPPRISESLNQFSLELEQAFGITR